MIHIFTFAATAASSFTNAGQSGLKSLAIALGRWPRRGRRGGRDRDDLRRGHRLRDAPAEMRAEITSIQWLGFALTEAIFFSGLAAGLLAFVL